MQNLKSLSNLLQRPVLGANDDTLACVGMTKVDLDPSEEITRQLMSKINEPQKKLLQHQLLHGACQD